MQPEKLNLVWFSATSSTKRIVKKIAEQFPAASVSEYDITQNSPEQNIITGANDLLIVGMPVYAGRIPAMAAKSLVGFKGNQTPAIIVCVYGNRDYDDALLELKDTVESNGFRIISAGAFIAQHSIFPAVGASRPDEKDNAVLVEFGKKSADLLVSLSSANNLCGIEVKGNSPYKIPGKIPLHPKAGKRCNSCGTCAALCPADAIDKTLPKRTDGKKCIACARCIHVCPQHARRFKGLLYMLAGKKFIAANSARKEPEVLYANNAC